MADRHLIWEGFRTGEVSPEFDGQTGFKGYYQACKRLENMVATPLGPAVQRPGFKYIADAKNANRKCRLVPFKFSRDQAYMLEFGHQYIRFYLNQGQLLEEIDANTMLLLSMDGDDASTTFDDYSQSDHTVTANGTAQIDDDQKKFGSGSGWFDGNSDYLSISDHADFDFSGGTFTVDFWLRVTSLPAVSYSLYHQNLTATPTADYMQLVLDFGGGIGFSIYTTAGGGTPVVSLSTAGSVITTNTWHHVALVENGNSWYIFVDGVEKASDTDTDRADDYDSDIYIGYDKANDGRYFNGWLDEYRVSDTARWTSAFTPPTNSYYQGTGTALEVATTYTEDELPDLQFAQSADILYIVHPNHKPAKLERSAIATWALSDITFIRRYYPSSDYVTSNFDNFTAADTVDDNTGTKAFDVDTSGASTYLRLEAPVDLDLRKISVFVKDAAIDGTFDIEHDDSGWVVSEAGWDLSTEGTGWVEKSFNSDGADTSKKWQLEKQDAAGTGGNVMEVEFYEAYEPSSWGTGTYPSCITFFEERLWLGYKLNVWASKSGDFYNLTTGTYEDDGLEYTLSSGEVNDLSWFASGKVMVIGTEGGEYSVSASGSNEAVTPLNVRIVKKSHHGSYNLEPVGVDNVNLFLSDSGKSIREFTYDFTSDSYLAPKMTTLAKHLFNYKVKYMAYQREPYSIVWAVNANGDLLGFTYDRSEEITAWHRHSTDGDFESIAVIPNTQGEGYDELWAVVKREINGSTVRYIEMMEKFPELDDIVSEDAFYVDSGITYNSASTDTISGLSHLEGEEVSVLADGKDIGTRTVSSGSITIPTSSLVHVGLAYDAKLQTMRLASTDRKGTYQGRKKRINSIVFRLYKTRQFEYGSTHDGTQYRVTIDDSILNDADNTLYSDDYKVYDVLGWGREGYVAITNDKPTPMTVVAIIPEYDIN